MTRFKAVVSYFGANYVGWQRQRNGISVQEKMENALEKVFGVKTDCTASGRTDAGVHAEGQVIHFDAETTIPADKIPFALNNELPDDISVLSCEVTSPDFNARFAAKRKTYVYKIYSSYVRKPMLEPTHYRTPKPLDVEAMRRAAKCVEGEHDFKCFEATGSKIVENTVRTVYSVSVEQNGEETCIAVCGNGFLYNMVRIIAGTLLYVGVGKMTPEDVKIAIESKDRTLAGKTLAAKGLHLVSVVY